MYWFYAKENTKFCKFYEKNLTFIYAKIQVSTIIGS